MIPGRKYARHRPWKPEEEKQLREMAEAGNTITMIALRLKRTVTAVRGRLGILKVSLHKVRRRPNESPPA
jgi:DNA invertase Pin-like site-specific DNA recombinase